MKTYQIWVDDVSNSNDSFVVDAPDVDEAIAAVIQVLKQLASDNSELVPILEGELTMIIDVIKNTESCHSLPHDSMTFIASPSLSKAKYKYHLVLVTAGLGYSIIARD